MSDIAEAKTRFLAETRKATEQDYWGHQVVTLRKPLAHPFKDFFVTRKVEQVRIAKACGVSQPLLSQVLNGYKDASEELQEKLEALVDTILEDERRRR